jgi:hypothetical protein
VVEPGAGPKIFCIGCGHGDSAYNKPHGNKSGTRSLREALKGLGYEFGSLSEGERLARNYLAGDFEAIVAFARTATAFKDVPFSLPGTFLHLDRHFPGAKFILTVRDSTEQWYSSITRYHGDWLSPGRLPTAAELKACDYSYPGYMWDVQCRVIGREDAPYDRATLFDFYEGHNAAVRAHFAGRDDLLEINVSEAGAYQRLCAFLGAEPTAQAFPWLNRTSS